MKKHIEKLEEEYLDDGGSGYCVSNIAEKINEIIDYINKNGK